MVLKNPNSSHGDDNIRVIKNILSTTKAVYNNYNIRSGVEILPIQKIYRLIDTSNTDSTFSSLEAENYARW